MARRADAALAALTTPEQQAIARRIFLRLVQFGEGRADTRRQQTVAELRGGGDDPILFEQTLHHLTADRLLTLSGDEQTANPSVDLAHEALISGWPRLQQWLGERREAEQTRRRLEAKAAEWVRLGRGSDGLLHGYELAEARQWLVSPDAVDLGYTADLADLVRASRKYQMKMRAILWGSLASIALIIGYILYNAIRNPHGTRLLRLRPGHRPEDGRDPRGPPPHQPQLQPDLDLVRDRLRAAWPSTARLMPKSCAISAAACTPPWPSYQSTRLRWTICSSGCSGPTPDPTSYSSSVRRCTTTATPPR